MWSSAPNSVFLLLLLGFVLQPASGGLYGAKSAVTSINSASFDRAVLQSPLPVLVEFYAPWCGHCKSLQPHWEKAANRLQGKVKVVAVDLDEEENKPLGARYGIQGFPTIKIFVNGKAIDYGGERTSASIVSFGLKHLGSEVKPLKKGSIDDFFSSSPELAHVLLFSKKKVPGPLFKALSLSFSGRLVFGSVHSSEKALLKEFGVRDLPKILMVAAGKSQDDAVPFSGDISQKSLTAFLKRYASPSDADDDFVPKIADESCKRALCTDLGGICIWLLTTVEELDDNRVYRDSLNEVAEQSDRSLFRFGYLSGSEQSDFIASSFPGVSLDFPRLVAFSPSKNRFATFLGAFTADNVKDFLQGVLSGRVGTQKLSSKIGSLAGETELCKPAKKPTKPESKPRKQPKPSGSASFNVELTESNFNKLVINSKSAWIVEFFAPWCGHCQQLAPKWLKAANSLKGVVRFGAVDATTSAALAQRYSVQGYPTIKVFPAGAKKQPPTDYQGARTAKALSSFASAMLPNEVRALKPPTVPEWSSKGHKALFVTTKAATPALVKALALEFPERKFGTLLSSPPILQLLQLDSAPALVVFNQGEKIVYEGEFRMEALREFFKTQSVPADAEAEEEVVEDLVPLVQTQEQFEELCVNKLGLCVIALANNANADQQKILQSIASKMSTRPEFHFVQISLTQQPSFASAFSLGNLEEQAISIVALHARKKKFASHSGAFNTAEVVEFLELLRKGKQNTRSIKSVPEIKQSAIKTEGCSAEATASEEGQCSPPAEKQFSKDEL